MDNSKKAMISKNMVDGNAKGRTSGSLGTDAPMSKAVMSEYTTSKIQWVASSAQRRPPRGR